MGHQRQCPARAIHGTGPTPRMYVMCARIGPLLLIISCASRLVLSSAGKLSLRQSIKVCLDRSIRQVGKQNVTFDKGFSIQDMPVSSAIMSPKDKEVIIHDGYVHCEGYVLVLRRSAV